ncbi:ribbon-helix-helix protein, CopG family [Nocardia sp. NPDC059177]|uniref:ribbon-helix-helix protein, CopG family n=1 Tax=Nocardia sp. NPDC059177 TaxID=3346759 RepID=UPI0036D06464
MSKLTDADYEAMAADYEANPITADEIIDIAVNPALLRMGRPRAGEREAKGKTPTTSVRLPKSIRARLHKRAEAEHVSEGEIIRRLLDAHLPA